jgi:hypothetical protein
VGRFRDDIPDSAIRAAIKFLATAEFACARNSHRAVTTNPTRGPSNESPA